jgi:hypothetical protein
MARGNSYQWAFSFIWQNSEDHPERYELCIGIVRDPKYGHRYDHAWIEDTTTGEVLNKYELKRKIEHTPQKDYYGLMHPHYVKRYSAKEMVKRVLKTGVYGPLENFPLRVLNAPDFKSPWKNWPRFNKRTKKD